MKTGFSINPYRQYFYCLCLRDSAVSVHYHNSFVDSHTSKRCGPPTPTPSPYIPMNVMSGLALGSRAGLGPLLPLIVSTMSGDTVILWELRPQGFPFLSASSWWQLCTWWLSCVMGAWLPPSAGPFNPLGRYNLPPCSSNFMSLRKGTIVRALSRLGMIFFSSPDWKGWKHWQWEMETQAMWRDCKESTSLLQTSSGFSARRSDTPGTEQMRLPTYWQWSWKNSGGPEQCSKGGKGECSSVLQKSQESRTCRWLPGELDFMLG